MTIGLAFLWVLAGLAVVRLVLGGGPDDPNPPSGTAEAA